MLFDGWAALGRVVFEAVVVYVVIVALLRWVGSQALAKMSAFDLVVSITLGSLVATIPLTHDVSLAGGIAALVTFLLLQELTRWLQKRFRAVHHSVRERPHLVVWDGVLLEEELHRINITDDEVRAAIRRAGMLSMSQAQAVVLENDGEWSVVPRGDARDLSAFEGIAIPFVRASHDEQRPDATHPAATAGPRWRESANPARDGREAAG